MPAYRVRAWLEWTTKAGDDMPLSVRLEMPDGDVYDLSDPSVAVEIMGAIWVAGGLQREREEAS